jgi:hypothetical protein
VSLPWAAIHMGDSPGYQRAHNVAGPAIPVGTKACSMDATLVIRVTYRTASSSIRECVNNPIKTLSLQAHGDRDEACFILERLSLHQGQDQTRRMNLKRACSDAVILRDISACHSAKISSIHAKKALDAIMQTSVN